MLTTLVASVCLVLPVHTGIIDSFRAPDCERCSGNRGLELAMRDGATVEAGLSGIVSWVGPVGGRLYLVLRSSTDPRVRITYGGLASTTVRSGDVLAVGDRVGVAGPSLFFGMRIGDVHVDPMRYVSGGGRSHPSVPPQPRFRITLGGPLPLTCGAGPLSR